MRHLGVELTHKTEDQILVKQTMILHKNKLVTSGERRQLDLTYEQAHDLRLQLTDFLGDFVPETQ